jgi:hypothetical protein
MVVLSGGIPQRNKNPSLPSINPWVTSKFSALNLPQITHDLPGNYMIYLPKFDGDKTRSFEYHMISFQDFTDDQFVEPNDIFMRRFVQNLEGYVRKWFRELPAASIDSWPTLGVSFMIQWGEKRDILYYLNEFISPGKRVDETIDDFNRRFNKLYNRIHVDRNPSHPIAKLTYAGEFDVDISMTLRERRSRAMLVIKDDEIEIEGDMIALGNIKKKKYQEEKKKVREGYVTSDPSGEPQEAKMDEMSRLIRNLKTKCLDLR